MSGEHLSSEERFNPAPKFECGCYTSRFMNSHNAEKRPILVITDDLTEELRLFVDEARALRDYLIKVVP